MKDFSQKVTLCFFMGWLYLLLLLHHIGSSHCAIFAVAGGHSSCCGGSRMIMSHFIEIWTVDEGEVVPNILYCVSGFDSVLGQELIPQVSVL